MYSLPLLILFVFLFSLYLAVKAAQAMAGDDDETPATFENVILGIRVPKGNEKQPLSGRTNVLFVAWPAS